MGTNSMVTVVDQQLRVHGLKGIRIVDGSVIPRLPSGPPNSIIAAIAKKASQAILND